MVNEKQGAKGTESTETSKGDAAGNQSEVSPIIADANSAAERMEKAREELKRENDRRENLLARERLAGKSIWTSTEPAIKEEDPRDYAARALAGKIAKK